MASNVTLATLRSRSKTRADMLRSNFVSDAEWNQFINDSAFALYDILVSKNEDYYTTSASVVASGSTDTFNLPATFYKIRGVDYEVGGIGTTMDKWVFEDRNKYQNNSIYLRYRIVGSSLVVKPLPSAQTFTVYFIPAFQKLVTDSDTLDGVNGWEEFIVVDAAIKARIKAESETMELEREKAQIMKRIEDMSANRDEGRPERVTDVTGNFPPYLTVLGDI